MVGFYGRERVTYRDLLYETVLASGGKCACSLAVNTYGNTENFVKEMNKTAKDLNLKKTHFKNPEGLYEKGQYSSTRDIGILLKEAIKDENFRSIFTTVTYASSKTIDHPKGKFISSTVLLKLKNYDIDGFKIIGGKSGTTPKASLC